MITATLSGSTAVTITVMNFDGSMPGGGAPGNNAQAGSTAGSAETSTSTN
jgi:hypothetical protein